MPRTGHDPEIQKRLSQFLRERKDGPAVLAAIARDARTQDFSETALPRYGTRGMALIVGYKEKRAKRLLLALERNRLVYAEGRGIYCLNRYLYLATL